MTEQKDATCKLCGKVGHVARFCRPPSERKEKQPLLIPAPSLPLLTPVKPGAIHILGTGLITRTNWELLKLSKKKPSPRR